MIRTRVFLGIMLLLSEVGGCQFGITSVSSDESQYLGSYTLLAQNCYSGAYGGNDFIDLVDGDVAPTGSPAVPFFKSAITQLDSGWTLNAFVDDSYPQQCPQQNGRNVQASDFVSGPALKSDFLWYTGHGGGGEVALYDSYPAEMGPSAPIGGTTSFGSNVSGITSAWSFGAPGVYTNPPISAQTGLKWVFLNSSHSVDNDSSDLTWVPAFNTSANGIHGVYGFELEPSSSDDAALAQAFLDGAITYPAGSPGPLNIRTAWIDAALGDDSGAYGVWELQNSGYDVLSGPASSGNIPPFALESELSASDSLNFFDTSGSITISPLQPIGNSSVGTYAAYATTPESYSDSSLMNMSNQYAPAYESQMVSSNEFKVTTNAYSGVHYETSGGVRVEMPMSYIAFNSTLASAQSFATSVVTNNANGMPSDAVLSETLTHEKIDNSGSEVLGYSFIWRHSNRTIGGDKIIVTVDNTSVTKCLKSEPIVIAGKPSTICTQSQTTYPMRASYVYRLWRTQSNSVRSLDSEYPEPSSASLYASVLSNPEVKGEVANLGSLQGYMMGFWTPDISSIDNTAYPAIEFVYSSGAIISADAYSGHVYQITQ